ncbi:protein FAM8A1 [Trichonephila clavipes]|nr:protein FAM8A1 [Trichonephila clavipes]
MPNSDSKQARKKNRANANTTSASKFNDLNINMPTYPYKSSSEYAAAVNQWLWQCYNWQCVTATIPYVMSQTTCRIQNNNADRTTDFNRNFPNTFFPNQNFSLIPPNQPNVAYQNINRTDSQLTQNNVYLIPSLVKRLAAEAIDFCILLILKVLITYVAVDFFDLVNLEKYDFDLIKHDKLDYQTAMEVTSEILTLEIMHRFVVCIFEGIFTQRGLLGPGGATPGKSIMRLRIVSCESVVQLDANTIRVYPGGDLGLGWALVRAFIKNFSYAFIFPICCTMYFFQHNRTAYDHICGSIVVEELPRRPRN